MTRIGFGFSETGLGVSRGPVNPSAEFFKGAMAIDALAREPIQNSIDARLGDGPVHVVFEMAEVAVKDLPGVQSLREAIECSAGQHQESEGGGSLEQAAEILRGAKVTVLRIGDFGTKGLTGTESQNDSTSPLSALTRGTGVSAKDGKRGGSFGIGSAVGLEASLIRTAYYASLPHDQSEVVLSGMATLATFTDSSGVRRNPDGILRDLSREDDYHYLRGWAPFAPFESRTEPGTDVYIPAFRWADEDPALVEIRDSVLRNFLVAIVRGELVVSGRTPRQEWTLTAENLDEVLRSSDSLAADVLPFYRALQTEPVVTELPRFGRVDFFMYADDSMGKSLWTVGMRRPHMRVHTFKTTSITVPYAGILICEGEEGNTLLRELEPPQHHEWDGARKRGGKARVDELRKHVLDVLRDRLAVAPGQRTTVTGLAKYLPADMGPASAGAGQATSADGDPSHREGATRTGGQGEAEPVPTPNRVRVSTQRPAVGAEAGVRGTRGGKDRGGKAKRRKSADGGPDGSVSEGGGASSITASDVILRSWCNGDRLILVVLNPNSEPVEGRLRLAALDANGAAIKAYPLDIEKAEVTYPEGAGQVSLTGDVLEGLLIPAGEQVRVELTLRVAQRMRIGVKDD